jgi:hypothetical protein
MTRRSLTGFSLALAVVAMTACDDGALSAPTVAPQFDGGTGLPREVTICKVGPAGTTGTFSVVGTPGSVGTYPFGSVVTLNAVQSESDLSQCKTVWKSVAPSDPTVSLVITETSGTPEEVFVAASAPFSIEGNKVTLTVNFDNGAVVRFTNGDTPPPPPPPGGGEGCTPGYWKQKQHFDSWTSPYTPDTQFSAVFEDAFPGMTLLEVLAQGGGGLNALGRHTVAALLNSASGGVDYDMTTTDVINAFNAAFPGGDYEALKGRLEGFNEQGCPLN